MGGERGKRSVVGTLVRCLRLRCPACGRSSIFQSPFKIRHHCPSCRALFQREEGFFVGALAINVVTTELVILAAYFLCLLAAGDRFELMLAALITLALLFPVAFYHHSWSAWLSLDHLLETLPHHGPGA